MQRDLIEAGGTLQVAVTSPMADFQGGKDRQEA
jgi:hypothetical protein